MMLGTVISIFLHLSLSGPVLPLSAKPQADSLTLRDTVKASRVTALRGAAVPMSTMDRKTIEALPATTVADAIRYFSGAQIKDYGGVGGLKTVNVRSLGAQHTGVFYNGVKIVNAQNGQVDLGRFSTDNIESITLYQAQKADLLQTASDLASAASVYIKSVEPEKTAVRASYRTGAFGTRNPAMYASYKGKVRATVDASFLQADGRYKFTFHEFAYDTTATRSNGDIKALRAEAGLYWKDFAFNGYLYSSERGLPGPMVRRVSEQYASKDRQWDRTVFVQGSWTRRFGKVSVQAKGKYTRDYCAYVQDPSKNAAVMPVDNRYWQSDSYLSAAASWQPVDWLGAGLALDGRRNGFASTARYPAAAAAPQASRLTGLAAAQLAASPGHGWHLQASLLYSGIKNSASGQTGRYNKLTPAVILSYKPAKQLRFRAFYKEIFRAPTFNDLYYTIGGRVNLNPEYTKLMDAGADWESDLRILPGGKIRLSADVHKSKVWDKIVAVPGISQFRWSVINYGKVDIKGAEANIELQSAFQNASFSIRANWTYEDARDHTDKTSQWWDGRIAYSPKHSGSIAAFAAWKNISLTASWLYTGKRYRDVANTRENAMAPWYTTDLSMCYNCTLGRLKGRFAIDANNLLDQAYEVVTRYPMPGRHFMFKLAIEY